MATKHCKSVLCSTSCKVLFIDKRGLNEWMGEKQQEKNGEKSEQKELKKKIKRKLISIHSLRNTSIFIVVILALHTLYSRVCTHYVHSLLYGGTSTSRWNLNFVWQRWIPALLDSHIFASFEWIQKLSPMMGKNGNTQKSRRKRIRKKTSAEKKMNSSSICALKLYISPNGSLRTNV